MAYQGHGTDISLRAGADFSAAQYTFVKVDSAGKAVAANATDTAQVGVVQNNPALDQSATVRVAGITKLVAGATVAAGALVTSDANGKAVAATTGKQICGIALSGGAAGEVISVLLSARGTAA